MRIFTEDTKDNKIGLLKTIPTTVEHYAGRQTEWTHIGHDGVKIEIKSGCMHCNNPKCYRFDMSQIESDITDFSFDKTRYVCPVDAISWNTKDCTPIIDNQKCIKCGICARMCPVGAIYFSPNATISQSEQVIMVPDSEHNRREQAAQITEVSKAFHIGYIFHESDAFMERMYAYLSRMSGNTPNMMTRNLLIALGNKCAISRVGDVYTRLDAMLETESHQKGVVEVEFGRDTLDASRGILDDIAVANCRYGIPKSKNLALVVCLQLPNERQGYWQVIKDIKKVEGISINTITIGALLILMWSFRQFDISEESFYVDFDNMSIRKKIDNILDSDSTVNISYRKLGILEPEK